jgi:hypothetical protein
MKFKTLGAILALALSVPFLTAAKPSGTITRKQVDKSVTNFVTALNSLSDKKALATLAPGDRMALQGKENMLSLVSERKLLNPKVEGFEAVKEGKQVIGARVKVVVEEVDPLDGTKVPRHYTWYLVREGKSLKVSVLSLWLARQDAEEEK